MIEKRIVAFAIAHPGFAPKRVSRGLAWEKRGGIIASPNGAWKVLCRHGLNTRAKPSQVVAWEYDESERTGTGVHPVGVR